MKPSPTNPQKPLIGYTGEEFNSKLNDMLAKFGVTAKLKERESLVINKPKTYQVTFHKQKK